MIRTVVMLPEGAITMLDSLAFTFLGPTRADVAKFAILSWLSNRSSNENIQ